MSSCLVKVLTDQPDSQIRVRVRSILVRTSVLDIVAVFVCRGILLLLRRRPSNLKSFLFPFPSHSPLPFRPSRPPLSSRTFLARMDSRLPPFFHHTLPIDRAPHARLPTREADRIGSDDRRGSEEGGVGVAEGGEEGVASRGRRGGD